jgi:hypothetical protein
MILSYDYAKQKRRQQRTNAPPPQAIRWPCGGVETNNAALPWKPLDAAIRRLLAPYCPGGRQGNSKQYKDVICTHFDGCFDGCGTIV